VGVALKEALLNAIFHGNLEISLEEVQQVEDRLIQEKDLSLVEQRAAESPYGDRRVHVDVNITTDEARFLVRDEGTGFDVASVPDPSDPSAMEAQHGRGLSLMRSFMDEVIHNDVGNEVTMVKRRDSAG
jgi:anti-sigma regulatory factor (Ser/Thr protein kinase)